MLCLFPIKPARLVLIRHANSQWNKLRIIQGSLDDPANTLSAEGFASVQPVLASLEKPHVLITSPILRCQQTAAAWFGVPFEQIPIPTKLVSDFREIQAGTYEGRSLDALDSDLLWQEWMKTPQTFRGFPQGETLSQFSDRILRATADVCEEYGRSKKRVCIVTHGVVMRVLKCHLAGQGLDKLWSHPVDNLAQISVSDEQIKQFQDLHKFFASKDNLRSNCP